MAALPPVSRRRLDNGLTVLLYPRPASPVVSVWMWHRVGSKNEPRGSTGAAHWLEHMLFKGSTHYPRGAVDRAILGVGGILNAFTDSDFTAYFSTVPREYVDLTLAIEGDRFLGATLPEPEIDRERSVVLSEREGNENHPEFRTEEELYAVAFRRHPYRWDALGYLEDIQGMHRENLRSFYERFYGPRNACLVVSGGFEPRALLPTIARRFGRLRREVEGTTILEHEPPQRGRRESTIQGPGSTPLVRLGWRAPDARGSEVPALLLLDLLLGGETAFYPTGGSRFEEREHPTSLLYQGLVDEGLATRAGSSYSPRVDPGLFTISAQAAPGRSSEELVAAVERITRSLGTTLVSADEIRRLRRRLLRGKTLSWEGATGSAFRLGFFWALGDLTLEPRLFSEALRVTPQRLKEAASGLFQDRALSVVRFEVDPVDRPGRGGPEGP